MSTHRDPIAGRRKAPRAAVAAALAFLLSASAIWGRASNGPDRVPPSFREPVTLSSRGGVLEVSLYVRQGVARLDTVKQPVHNFLLFSYELHKGAASNGQRTGKNLYPGPTLQVNPGETLIVHVVNELADLTIPDFYDPAFTRKGEDVALYPRQLTSSPFNLHTHGLHVSPKGNADNVLLHIPPGYTNTYRYDVPADHPEGLYWYHSHRHTLTAQHTYLGLAGMLVIGRADGDIPLVTRNAIPIRTMAIQYNYVFDRAGGQSILNNYTWPEWVSTAKPPQKDELARGTYEPRLAPLNFWQSRKGTRFFTVWWSGPLSIENMRGQFQLLPSNLQSFASEDGAHDVAAHPALPDHRRDLQFTINGQFQPVLRTKAGQTEVWLLANVSDIAYARVRLTETATGRHPPIALLGQDGNPYLEVHHPSSDGGTTLVIPPGSRYAIAVTMPRAGGLVLEMPPASGIEKLSRPGILYTNDGGEHPPAVLGKVEVEPSAMSYFDGFFAAPTQVLARVEPERGAARPTAFERGQVLEARSSFVDLAAATPVVQRRLLVSGGFQNEHANDQDPKAFEYEFASNVFPNVPLLQPRLGSIEEWSFINHNNDEHPIHVHVNDFQVTRMVDPVRRSRIGVQPWGEDNANLPAPLLGPRESVLEPGTLSLRSTFTEFTGAFVMHCHRLNHEDNGLMAMVNIIPAVSSFAVAHDGAPGTDATVRVYDASGDALLATATPFPGFRGSLRVAMGDVDGDQVLDLVAAKGPGGTPEVIALSGAGAGGDAAAAFRTPLLRFLAFDASFTGGIDVAAANVDGNALVDNVIVGAGPGVESSVKVFGSGRPRALGTAPETFATFSPYPGSRAGVAVAAGMVDAVSGRASIVTAPGPGDEPRVKIFRFDLYEPNAGAAAWCAPANPLPPGVPLQTAEILAFDASYRGGVSLATGWATGPYGGGRSIAVAQTAAPGVVKLFSSGSALDGQPALYLESPDRHDGRVAFREIASFAPFEDSPRAGVQVALTSTVHGADVLASGVAATGSEVRVRKYAMERTPATAATLSPRLLADVETAPGTAPRPLGGA